MTNEQNINLIDPHIIGKKGGDVTKERHGREHFVKMADKSHEVLRKIKSPEFFKERSRLGVLAKARKMKEKKNSVNE